MRITDLITAQLSLHKKQSDLYQIRIVYMENCVFDESDVKLQMRIFVNLLSILCLGFTYKK